MASINKEPGGRRTVQFVAGDGRRRSVRLGKCSHRAAEVVKLRIEQLLSSKLTGDAWSADLAGWTTTIDVALADRLAAAGLIPVRGQGQEKRLAAFLDEYLARRGDVKPASRVVWGQVIRDLKAFFKPTKRLVDVSPADALDFKAHLVDRGLSATTIAKRIKHARMFFQDAVQRELLVKNPFQGIKTAAPVNLAERQFVDRATVAKIMAVCDPTWRAIVALSRYGGLRCPSEVLSLRWIDIDWDAGTMRVSSPKTAHHQGKESRLVPLFPEVRGVLDEAWESAPAGAEFVIDAHYRGDAFRNGQWKAINLRTQFQRILERAGIAPWPKLFHALRSSRETELAAEHPVHVAAAWLGNSPAIAAKHYLLVRQSDYDKAVQKAVQNPVQQVQETTRNEPHAQPRIIVFAEKNDIIPYDAIMSVETKGLEPSTPGLQSRCSPN